MVKFEGKYLFEQTENVVIVHKDVDGTFKGCGFIPNSYAIDCEMNNALRTVFAGKEPVFILHERKFFLMPESIGEIAELHIQIMEACPSFHDKIRYIEQTQFISKLEEKEYEDLLGRLRVFKMTLKLSPKVIP